MMRGVEKQGSTMASSVMLGDFGSTATRSEFLRLIGNVDDRFQRDQMAKIHIQDLRLRTYIGINDDEQNNRML